MICERCDGDGWVEVFGDAGFPVGARDCEECGGSGSITPFDPIADVFSQTGRPSPTEGAQE